MKRLLKTTALLMTAAAALLGTAACQRCNDAPADGTGETGRAVLSIGVASTRADISVYPWTMCDIKLYKYNRAGLKELVRRYFDAADLPAEMWLTEGDYSIDVSLGDRSSTASFDRPLYHGTEEFSIAGGATTAVEVRCTIQNTMVKVLFDPSVDKTFDLAKEGGSPYSVTVMTGDRFDHDKADSSNSLIYTDNAQVGYFFLPDGQDKISFCFHGYSSDSDVIDGRGDEPAAPSGEIHEHYHGYALDTERLEGYCYEIRFTYSPDAEGFLAWDMNIVVDEVDAGDEYAGINPAPKPTVEGDGFDIDRRFNVESELRYRIASSDRALTRVEIACDNEEPISVDCTEEGVKQDGISVEFAASEPATRSGGAKELTLTIGKEFLDRYTGGRHTFVIRAYTGSSVFGEVTSRVTLQGVAGCSVIDHWNGIGEVNAYAFGEDAQLKVLYRVRESEQWSEVSAAADSNGLCRANVPVAADTEYEYRLSINGEQTGLVYAHHTENGPQIPNGDMELWSKPDKPYLPYVSESDQWWDTGNHGSTTLSSSDNVTTPTEDVHEGSAGRYAAYLTSKKVVIALAAGNIFIGQYLGTNGTNGSIGLGREFPFTFRPRKLRFWVKAKAGTVDMGSGAPEIEKNGPDINEVYILLCNMGGPHVVDTRYQSTFVHPSEPTIGYCTQLNGKSSANDRDDGHVIAWGVWDNSESIDQWEVREITLIYNEQYEGEMPNYLMLTASASKYGDYFMGSTSSRMYLDDIEFVY